MHLSILSPRVGGGGAAGYPREIDWAFISSFSESLEQAKLGQVWKWIWVLEIRSEKWCGKWHFFILKQGKDLENQGA